MSCRRVGHRCYTLVRKGCCYRRRKLLFTSSRQSDKTEETELRRSVPSLSNTSLWRNAPLSMGQLQHLTFEQAIRRYHTSYFMAEVSAKPNLFLRMKKDCVLGHPVYTMYNQYVTQSVDAPSIHTGHQSSNNTANLHATSYTTAEFLPETNK